MFQSADSAPSSTVLGAPVIGAIVHLRSPLSPTNWHKISPILKAFLSKKEPSPPYRLVFFLPSFELGYHCTDTLTQSGLSGMIFCARSMMRDDTSIKGIQLFTFFFIRLYLNRDGHDVKTITARKSYLIQQTHLRAPHQTLFWGTFWTCLNCIRIITQSKKQ